jgi:hypothetical protein
MKIKWLDKPQDHDYAAARSYLMLEMEESAATAASAALQCAEMSSFQAKDIFRSSGLSLLGVSDSHVEKDRKRIILGEKLSPLLLFRNSVKSQLIVADGYHRLCAVYKYDEDADIPCKIA